MTVKQRQVAPSDDQGGIGLGDVVEAIARPVARLFKRGDCPKCQKNKAALNKLGKIRIGRVAK